MPVRVAIEVVPNVVEPVTVRDDWVPLHPIARTFPLPSVDNTIPSAGTLFRMLFARSWICPEPVAAVIGA